MYRPVMIRVFRPRRNQLDPFAFHRRIRHLNRTGHLWAVGPIAVFLIYQK